MNGWITLADVHQTRYQQDGEWVQCPNVRIVTVDFYGSGVTSYLQITPEDAREFAMQLIEQAVTSGLVNLDAPAAAVGVADTTEAAQ